MRASKIQFGGLPPAQPFPNTGITSRVELAQLAFSGLAATKSPASLTPLLARRPGSAMP